MWSYWRVAGVILQRAGSEIKIKKIWKCSNCKQVSTRKGNLKRHIQRKHKGIGKPVKQFIYGNSIFTPPETAPTQVVFKDQYSTFKPPSENPIFYSNPPHHIEFNDDWFDKYFKPVLRLLELQLKVNSEIQPLNLSIPKDLPQFSSWPNNTFIGIPTFIGTPEYIRADGISQEESKISRNYDGVSGFRAGICQKCLATILMRYWIPL